MGSAGDMVDITRDNFEDMFPLVEEALKDCNFFSLDCEMTGLFVDGARDDYLDEMCDRYAKLRESSQSYIINQFGLSCFKLISGPSTDVSGFEAKTFNFYIFPEPLTDNAQARKFLSDSGSLSFLAHQKFDFNKWIYKGIPFMPTHECHRRRRELTRYYTGELRTNSINPTKPEDQEFVRLLIEQVQRWLSGAEPSLVLFDMNSYRRLLAYQELEKPQFGKDDYPGFFVKKIDVGNGYSQLQLIRGTQEEVIKMQQEDVQQRMHDLDKAIGFTRVIEAMKACRRPAVGHNCMFDIAYVLAACVDPKLPPSWPEYKQLVEEWFPGGIFDTKLIARQVPEIFKRGTSLGEVFKGVTEDDEVRSKMDALFAKCHVDGQPQLSSPHVRHAPGFEKYALVEAGGAAHEAGYDSFMTGTVFAHLIHIIRAKDFASRAAIMMPEAVDQALVGGGPLLPAQLADLDLNSHSDSARLAGGDSSLIDAEVLLQPVNRFKNCLNIMRTDMPYAAVCGLDPPLSRPNVFHVSGLPSGGTRADEIITLFQAEGLGRPRVTLSAGKAYGPPSTGALVEVDAELASDVLHKLMGVPKPVEEGKEWNVAPIQASAEGQGSRGSSLRVIPWEQWSKERVAAVATATQQQEELRPSKRSRIESSKGTPITDQLAAAGAAAGVELIEKLQGERRSAEVRAQQKSGGCLVM
ncbi:hypothetical protein CEUSTIGMA_g13198.t1 [Chlamydomonas eustigma]|uniref:Uncharacterized protein n=1 Tax=Chlamydomonas eustigma TaxID=1157962 RepID=A0A250XRZ1_9CHLO|nr:hypothetical protein CEUSTIGMA_g13198.t1 [Chlamydomonas eustigma]|eukprot:GAX85783.1 hypothetical protein CEUSTIGMA_g13198.t1 [Chlamydomonas eustigma]